MDTPNYLSQASALSLIDAENPPCVMTAKAWHDRIQGPRDTAGRRIWTPEVCARIREARTQAKSRPAAA